MVIKNYNDLYFPPGECLPLVQGVWGKDDQLGMLNFIDDKVTIEASSAMESGRRFSLNMPINFPYGSLKKGSHPVRSAPARTVYKRQVDEVIVYDDKLDDFYLQGSTQWDGLTHIGDVKHGFYNGVMEEDVNESGATRNGIEHFSKFGIASRGVLVDIPRCFERLGWKWSSVGSQELSARMLAQCLESQGCALKKGDILLLRTGWITDFLNAKSSEEKNRLFVGRDYSGLAGNSEMWEFLWNSQIAAVAADSVTVERFPLTPGQASLHLAIARMGLVLGEMFNLDGLADACDSDSRYECFFVSSPLNVPGGVGAPANAMAIR